MRKRDEMEIENERQILNVFGVFALTNPRYRGYVVQRYVVYVVHVVHAEHEIVQK